MLHSTRAQDPAPAFCSCAALQGKLKPALLVSGPTPIRLCTSYSTAESQDQLQFEHQLDLQHTVHLVRT